MSNSPPQTPPSVQQRLRHSQTNSGKSLGTNFHSSGSTNTQFSNIRGAKDFARPESPQGG